MRYGKNNISLISTVILVVLFLLFLVIPGFAQSPGTWEIGFEVSDIRYEEPGIMENEGVMYGICASYTHRADHMFRIEGRYAAGQVDYTSTSTGKMDDIDDYLFELRFLFGSDFQIDSATVLTPYIGLGYRYLNDDSAGMTTSTGHKGYERESNYYYSPIGIELMHDFGNNWSWGFTAEYDIFWKGVQKSHLSDANPSFGDMENDQNDGYGARGSIKLLRKGETTRLLIEPYIRYWDIDKSEVRNITYSGVIVGYGWEPENDTTEIGLKIGIIF
ncbi:MAG: autotransporter outer membrane beta-barrel domain-containing protein [Deltaproteobacteria bacterium]|nr:autotransporter outer membrane beta-barrel domain-containing protein [Deltaproteobacteria bacterium]